MAKAKNARLQAQKDKVKRVPTGSGVGTEKAKKGVARRTEKKGGGGY